MSSRLATLFAVLAAVLLFTAPASARKNLILDTDIFSDCECVPLTPLSHPVPLR